MQAVQMLMLPTFMNIVGKMLVLFLTKYFYRRLKINLRYSISY